MKLESQVSTYCTEKYVLRRTLLFRNLVHTHTKIKLKKEKNEKNVGQVIPPPSASPSDFAREGHTAHYYGSCCFGYLVISPK